MKKSLVINPYINHTTELSVIEAELRFLLDYAEKEMDWDLTEKEERHLMALTKLARAKGSKQRW